MISLSVANKLKLFSKAMKDKGPANSKLIRIKGRIHERARGVRSVFSPIHSKVE